MKIFSLKQTKLSLLLCLLILSFSVQAVVIRHDKADSRYRVDESSYSQIFFLHTRYGNKVCVATLISPQWAITAAHCTEQTPIKATLEREELYPLQVAGSPYKIIELVIHPNHRHSNQGLAVDLALIKLDRPVRDVEPVQLYAKTDEENQIVSFLGWGFTGIGTLGRKGNDGRLRRAENTVTKADQWLRFLFDDPRQKEHSALPLEGVPGLGDSGGPAFLETEGRIYLVGVALGELASDDDEEKTQGLYGATELYERISSHLGWITGVIKP